MARETREASKIVRLAVLLEAGTLLLALVLGWLLDFPPLRQMRFRPLDLAAGIVATGPLLLCMRWCSQSQLRPLRALMAQVNESLVPLFMDAPWYSLLLISALAGLGEEFLFRGVLQSGLTVWIGLPLALVAASTLFGLAHLITPTYAVLAGLIGFYFGILTVVTESLLAPVLAHALYDFSALLYLISSKRNAAAQPRGEPSGRPSQ